MNYNQPLAENSSDFRLTLYPVKRHPFISTRIGYPAGMACTIVTCAAFVGWRMEQKRLFRYRRTALDFRIYQFFYSTGEKSSFPTPQRGHTQSSGISSKAVPACIPLSGSPWAGSYMCPQTLHSYFFMINSDLIAYEKNRFNSPWKACP